MIAENYKEVLENIRKACEKVGRNPEEVTLISVSKTKPLEDLQAAYAAGARDFGENKVQEINEKFPAMPQDARFHMIGHLQTNKVKGLLDKVCLIHSVDSLHLAQAISKEAVKTGIVAKILVEINVAQEESKFGSGIEESKNLVFDIAQLPGIMICGLMTVAPYVDDPEENRTIFRQLKEFSIDIARQNKDNISMSVLSMGMTGDYMVAVEEGSTMVRVGTGIFGARDYGGLK